MSEAKSPIDYPEPRNPELAFGRMPALRRWFADRRDQMLYPGTTPSFLGIGAHKGGTTWLHWCLREHRECFLPHGKELHYFDWNLDRPLSTYLKHFKQGRGKVIGEITPTYGEIRPQFIERVRAVNPRMKIILIMRNPVDREWSHALMDLVKYGGKRPEELTEADLMAHFDRPYTQRFGDYATMIENWSAAFGRERLQTHFFEDVALRPRELLESVFDFIGVSRDFDWENSSYNKVVLEGVGKPMPPEYREYLRKKYTPMIERLAGMVGERPLAWLEPQG